MQTFQTGSLHLGVVLTKALIKEHLADISGQLVTEHYGTLYKHHLTHSNRQLTRNQNY